MNNQIKSLIGNRRLFFQSLLFLVIISTALLLFFGKAFGSIPLDAYHPFWLNVFFINYTFMGDGIFAICLVAIFLFYFKRKKESKAILLAFIFTEITVQLIKNGMNVSKPCLFFEEGQTLFDHGLISSSVYYSFPSGHTAIAFALATVLVLVIKKAAWQLPILAAAVLLGYSRIYLAQHDLGNVLIAAVLGTLSGSVAVHLVYNRVNNFAKFRNIFKARYKDRIPGESVQTLLNQ